MCSVVKRRYCGWHAALVMLTAGLYLAHPVAAQRDLQAIPDPDPELERQSFIVADGFEVNLFVSDPQIAKPIQISFDAEGRLWIASSQAYPQIRPGQLPDDKILVVEDRDGDGRADHTTVFADGLLIPTGVLPGDGGVYVAHNTELLFLRDTDGDGRCDERRVVLDGFGTEDTHHLLHTLRWGHDGAIYMNQSIYIHSHVETPYGVRRLNGGGIWRFRPDTGQLEIFCRGFVNPWGHHFDYWGQSFATDGAYVEGINYVFPGAVFVTAPGAVRRVVGLNPGSPKHCGLEIISGRHFPPDWQGNMITNDFRANRVCRFVVTPREQGAGYISRQEAELIKTSHVAFRPVDVKMGPDGALYIADWYNPIIQHGEVDFRDPRRDHAHGRIWRVTAKGRPLVPRVQIVGAPVEKLLDLLREPEEWVRLWAKLELRTRGAAQVVPHLDRWWRALDTRDPLTAHHRLEALWCYQTLNVPAPDLLSELLSDADARVRAAAVRVLSEWRDRIPDAVGLLRARVRDAHPQVRLEAVRALAEERSAEAAAAALTVLDQPMDELLDFALWQAMRELQPYWLPQVRDGNLQWLAQPSHLAYALAAIDAQDATRPLLKLLDHSALSAEQRVALSLVLIRSGGQEGVHAVWRRLIEEPPSDASQRLTLYKALAETARLRKVHPGDARAAILNLLQPLLERGEPAEEELVTLLQLCALWRVEEARSLAEQLAQNHTSPAVVDSSLEVIAALGDQRSKEFLQQQATSGSAERRLAATAMLTRLDSHQGLTLLVPLLSEVSAAEAERQLRPLLAIRGLAPALVRQLDSAQLPPDTARRLIRLARQEVQTPTDLIAALEKAGRLEQSGWRWNAELAQQLVSDALKLGDPQRGQSIYRRADLQCMQCHAIAGAGGQVGPDLASIGASAPPDYIVESLLAPSAKVKENYHSLVVVAEGRVYTGIPVRRTETELVLRDAKDQEVVIPVNTIEEQQEGRSLMPDGCVDPLTRDELLDLIRFLSELGKLGPFAVGRQPVLRNWQVLEPSAVALEKIRRHGFDIVATDNPAHNDPAFRWRPFYATVQGDLPLDELPVLQNTTFVMPRAAVPTSFLRTTIEIDQAGPCVVQFSDVTGLACWWDGRPVGITQGQLRVPATPGRHVLTIALDRTQRTEPLRATLEQGPVPRTGP
jgi:putative heme-binding domain-containing protein